VSFAGADVGPVVKLTINLDNLAGDRAAIAQCARFVQRRIAEVGAAEAWISCGQQLAHLKSNLLKSSPRGDNARIGWKQAFQLEPREFPFSLRFADYLITIHDFFDGITCSTKKLPSSVGALRLLATKFKSEIVERCVADSSISPGMTEIEVKSLAKKLHLIKEKPKRDALKEAPKNKRVAAVLKLMGRLNLTIEDLHNG
jgi:hypothetical protein